MIYFLYTLSEDLITKVKSSENFIDFLPPAASTLAYSCAQGQRIIAEEEDGLDCLTRITPEYLYNKIFEMLFDYVGVANLTDILYQRCANLLSTENTSYIVLVPRRAINFLNKWDPDKYTYISTEVSATELKVPMQIAPMKLVTPKGVLKLLK